MSSTGSGNEDTVPPSYPYYWSHSNSDLSVDDFVKKYKPSMVQNDGTKPWLWVQNSNAPGNEGDRAAAVKEATELLNEASERIKNINEDDSIPIRASKKAGTKSKKQLKEEIQTEYYEKLKEVHRKHGYRSGKWLIFIGPDTVDVAWSRLAASVVNGPLSKTAVHLAKVATTPKNESSVQRVICVYMPNVFDKEEVTAVMKVLLRNHGLQLSGVKSNLCTEIGLDSKHASHIQSTIWKNVELLKDDEIKELKSAFFAGLKGEPKDDEGGEPPKKPTTKPKPVADDPFGSDEDESKEEEKKLTVSKRKSKAGEAKDDGKPPSKKKRT